MKISNGREISNTTDMGDGSTRTQSFHNAYEIDIGKLLIWIVLIIIAYELMRVGVMIYIPSLVFTLLEIFIAVYTIYYISVIILSYLMLLGMKKENEWNEMLVSLRRK